MRIPTATYRLQLRQGLDFAAASALVPYLDDLGISDCYTSPFLAAAPGSTHGYDVVDHARIDPQLGTEVELIAFARRLRDREMGLLIDVVPNHMSIAGADNRWWSDVLENGPASPFARYFDIDWYPPKADLEAKILLPILGDQFGHVLERGEISIRYEGDTFVAAYHDTRLPIAPRSWPHLLEPMLAELRASLGADHPSVLELESIRTSIDHLPLRTDRDRERVRERQREKAIARRRLAALVAERAEVAGALARSVTAINGTPGDPASVDRLEALLAEQGYRPSFWRVAADEINYRRFFDINELAAIRVEEPGVLHAVHEIALRLAAQGLVTGLRIDHVDGLLFPSQYLHELRRSLRVVSAAPASDLYIVVEKVLGPGERLRDTWPVQGTTGYEVAALLTGVLLDPGGLDNLSEVYRAFTAQVDPLEDVLYESKKVVLRSSMSAELTVLARKLDDVSEQHRTSRDFTLNSLQEALGELIACFPVYRTYVEAGDLEVGEVDRQQIERAVAEAKRRNPATSASIYDFVRSLLLLEAPAGLDRTHLAARRDFMLRFQQLTSPIMAKGLEDTAFYRHVSLAAQNEVGGGAHHGTVTLEAFHTACAHRAVESPYGLSATATQDTKRGEDTRARLCVLSELPALWQSALGRLTQLARPHKQRPDVPDANESYLLYQTLLGAWPPGLAQPDATFVARIQAYLRKAVKEAKVHSSWINPDERYDQDVATFAAALLDPDTGGGFLDELGALRAAIEPAGRFNSLSQVVLKIGMPGVPDLYQGTELWDHSLVDPDNRRPVDFDRRARMLAELRREGEADAPALIERLLAEPHDGRIKMFVTARALGLRRARRALFRDGDYQAVPVSGTHHDRVIAFARAHQGDRVLVACGRHYTAIAAPADRPVGARWADTTLQPGAAAGRRYRDTFTGRTVETSAAGSLDVREVFAHLPVAMLEALP